MTLFEISLRNQNQSGNVHIYLPTRIYQHILAFPSATKGDLSMCPSRAGPSFCTLRILPTGPPRVIAPGILPSLLSASLGFLSLLNHSSLHTNFSLFPSSKNTLFSLFPLQGPPLSLILLLQIPQKCCLYFLSLNCLFLFSIVPTSLKFYPSILL